MRQILPLSLLLMTGINVQAQTVQKQPATTSQANQAINPIHLPDMIKNSQQIVLFTPKLKRVDIAEGIRQALVNRGSDVILITNQSNFWTSNSLTLRILLMGAKTYQIQSTAPPFILLDGALYSGQGIVDAGTVIRDRQHEAQVVKWMNNFLIDRKALPPETQVAEWIRRANLGLKESDLPPKTLPKTP